MISDTLDRGGIQRKAASGCPELTSESFRCAEVNRLNHPVLRLCPPGTGGALFGDVSCVPGASGSETCLLMWAHACWLQRVESHY